MYKWYKTAIHVIHQSSFKHKFLSSHTYKVCYYLCLNKMSCAFSSNQKISVHVYDTCVVYLFIVLGCSCKRKERYQKLCLSAFFPLWLWP